MKETFSRFDEENDSILYRFYGVITASFGKVLLLGSLSAIANKNFLVGFSKTRMVMIRLDMFGKQKEPVVIYYQYIQNVHIKSWMFGIGKKINIKLTDCSKIRFNLYKANQKDNLNALCDLISAFAAWD